MRPVVSTPLFAGVPGTAVDAAMAEARSIVVDAGGIFYSQGEPAASFFVLRDGRVKLSQISAAGHEIILRVIAAGEPLGAVAAIEASAVYPVTATAVETSHAYAWDGEAMRALMVRCPSIALNAARLIAQRLHDLQRQHREMMTERVDSRIARALLRLLPHSGRPVRRGVEIAFPLSQQELAQMAGTTLFTVSRTLGEWEEKGLIETSRRRVVIRQPQALLSICDDSLQ